MLAKNSLFRIVLLSVCCLLSTLAWSLAPTITSFTPTSGPVGTVVTVTGMNLFDLSPAKCNGTPAFDVRTIIIAPGSTTGKLTITTSGGTGTSTTNFVVIPNPSLTTFTPASGPIGQMVTITGTNFTGASSVTFNGTTASYSVASATSITATVPAGATTGTISITTPGGTTTSTTAFIVIPAPTITSFTPASGPIGQVVTLTGTDFTGASGVKFNGMAAVTFSAVNATSLTATVPAGATTGKISVSTRGGTATSATDFTVIPTPTITSFTPAAGPSGQLVTITGANLTGTSAVKFNGVAATSYTVVSATTITATVPVGAMTGKITVTTLGGTATSTTAFTVVPAPAITSFTPASGNVGASVTITGTNFTGAKAVQFNGTTAITFSVVSATSITATVPAGATSGKLTVITPGGTATSAAVFTVTSPEDASIKALYAAWGAGFQARNITNVMACYSTAFLNSDHDYANQQSEVQDFLNSTTGSILVTFSNFNIQVTGTAAKVSAHGTIVCSQGTMDFDFYPVESQLSNASGPEGMAYLKKEAAGWRIYGNQLRFNIFVRSLQYQAGGYSLFAQIEGNDTYLNSISHVTVTGPGTPTGGTSLSKSPGDWFTSITLPSPPPTPPLVYTFTYTDAAGTHSCQRQVTSPFLNSYAMQQSPANNATITTGTPTFTWQGITAISGVTTDPITYAVEVRNAAGNMVWSQWGVEGTSIVCPTTLPSGAYTWAVYANIDGDAMSCSKWQSFTVK